VVTFVCLFLVAANEVRKSRAKKKNKPTSAGAGSSASPVTPSIHKCVGAGESLRDEPGEAMREVA
jgi:hypothetical protein